MTEHIIDDETAEKEPGRYEQLIMSLIFGAVLIGGAVFMQGQFAALAAGEEESVRVWWGFAGLYKTFGPRVTVAVTAVIGLLMIAYGVFKAISADDTIRPRIRISESNDAW